MIYFPRKVIRMDILKQLNDAVAYIETHLSGETDLEELSRITLSTPDELNRFFRYMTGMTVREYVRRRRLTRAAYELRASSVSVLDTAVKYGYDSADAFTKAFIKQHGVSPTKARETETPLKVYPPLSFCIMIKGAREMNFRIIETAPVGLLGLSKQFMGEAADRFEQEHVMWGVEYDDYMKKIDGEIPGTWYGIWNNGIYSISKKADEVCKDGLEKITVPSGTYAVFATGFGGFAGDELPRLRSLIFDSWLQDSGYVQASDLEIEVYHLYPKGEKHRRHYELWIPLIPQRP